MITTNLVIGNYSKSCKRQLQQILPEATNPGKGDGNKSHNVNYSKACNMHQLLQYSIASSDAKCNKSCNINCNKPRNIHQNWQYSMAMKPAKCNCNKSCNIPLQKNSGAVGGGGGGFWHEAAQIFVFHPAAEPAASTEQVQSCEAKLRRWMGQAAARIALPRCNRPRVMGQGAQILTLEEGSMDLSPGWRGKPHTRGQQDTTGCCRHRQDGVWLWVR